MTKLDPYLTFPGTAREAIQLYTEVFNPASVEVMTFADMPHDENAPELDQEGAKRILHASLQIGNDHLMLSDAPPGQDHTVVKGTQTHISIGSESKGEADRIFKLLCDGGEVVMPMADAFWGDYFGMCKDRFGIPWMINCRTQPSRDTS